MVVSAVIAAIVVVFAGVSSAQPTAGDATRVIPSMASYEAGSTEQVQTETYDLGAEAFRVPEFDGPIELQGVVYHPKSVAGRHLPLVAFVHGMHSTCEKPEDSQNWPCAASDRPIPSYRGYDYLGTELASHGYVVLSISANGTNAGKGGDDMTARAKLIQKHLDLWRDWSTRGGGPFGDRFVGAIDFSRVGTMGHSRGGEAVLQQLQINAAEQHPYGIKAVLSLAPSEFQRRSAPGVALAVVLPECDGDQIDLDGIRHFDDSRYALGEDPTAKYALVVRGTNHNFFNTIWSPGSGIPWGHDDWGNDPNDSPKSVCRMSSPTRLTETQQRQAGAAWIASFFRYQLGGERQFAPIWQGRRTPPSSFGSAETLLTYHAPSGSRLDVNRLLNPSELRRNTAGGSVTFTGFESANLCGGPPPEPAHCLPDSETKHALAEPHEAGYGAKAGLSILKLTWSKPGAIFRNDLPGDVHDLTAFRDLRFRAAVDFTDAANPVDKPQNLRVLLTDRFGHTSSTEVAPYTKALDYPPLIAHAPVWDPTGDYRRFLLNQVRVPLTAFHGIDLNDIRSVTLVFDATPQGSIGIADLNFTQ